MRNKADYWEYCTCLPNILLFSSAVQKAKHMKLIEYRILSQMANVN